MQRAVCECRTPSAVHTLPWWGLTGEGRNIRSTDNEDVLRAYSSDPLFLKSTRTDALYRMFELMAKGAAASSHLGALSVLLLYGGKDQIIPRGATELFAKMLGPAAMVKFYLDGYHILLRDHAGAARTADIAVWIHAVTQQNKTGGERLNKPCEVIPRIYPI